jgi:hypothetical protein
MEAGELEKNLEELEERIERVRALYEQYFCGIEKIEPQIPRKDVDRRIFVLRKEQIRNTAMRFKFQTLIQRYNTMGQHWGRVLREIENGTFKRDLARAAARFGVDDALTAVSRKRAERLAKGLEAQLEREGRRKKEAGEERRRKREDDYAEVDDAELVADDFDDDAPTPPPVRREPSAPSHAFGVVYPGEEHAARGYPPAPPSQPQVPPAQQPGAPAPPAAQAQPKRSGGGLRLGGGPGARRPNMDALTRIAHSLEDDIPRAAVEIPGRAARSSAPAAPSSGGGAPRPLLSAPIDVEVPPHEPARPEPKASGRKPLLSSPIDVDVPASEPKPPGQQAPKGRKPLLSAPIGVEIDSEPPPPKPKSVPPKKQEKPAPAASAPGQGSLGLKPPPKAGPPSEPAPGRAEAERDAKRASASAKASQAGEGRAVPPPKPSTPGDLSDTRLREIYSQYVQARRERNESTAGITFDKLADSLRSQAEKLKSKHSAKRVDYEIVVKDGKTLIKPIVK